jgi:uracil-DNA glycosylase
VTTLVELAREAASYTRCDLHQRATATVFGEGRLNARLALVAEQPGDQEDKQGHPFVGPAGYLLDRVLRDSGERVDDFLLVVAEQPGSRVQRVHQRVHVGELGEVAFLGDEAAVQDGAVDGDRYRTTDCPPRPRTG